MPRKTEYLVYVPLEVMKNPSDLMDAVLTHMIRKETPITVRRQFMRDIMRAPTPDRALEAINEWVQIRDVAKFPFNKGKKSAAEEAAKDAAEAIAKSGLTAEEVANDIEETTKATSVSAEEATQALTPDSGEELKNDDKDS